MAVDPYARSRRLGGLLERLRELGPTSKSTLVPSDPGQALDDLRHLEVMGLAHRSGEGRLIRWSALSAEPRRGLLDRIALRLGRGVLVFLDGTSLAEVFERLGADGERAKHLDRKFFHLQEPARRYADKADVLDRIIDGLVKERALVVEYRDGAAETVRPLTLVLYRRAVYLLALDAAEEVQRLAVERIRTARLAEPFSYPDDWDPAAELGPHYGIYKGGAAERVVLRFAASRAELVKARDWHPTARLRTLPDGRVELVMRASGPELVRLALEWGPCCEVVAPDSLRRQVVEELRGALGLYGASQEALEFPASEVRS